MAGQSVDWFHPQTHEEAEAVSERNGGLDSFVGVGLIDDFGGDAFRKPGVRRKSFGPLDKSCGVGGVSVAPIREYKRICVRVEHGTGQSGRGCGNPWIAETKVVF